MKIFEQMEDEDIVEALIKTLEKTTEKKIFTMRVIGEQDEGLEVAVAFQDKSMLMGLITVGEIDGQLAARVRGNYL